MIRKPTTTSIAILAALFFALACAWAEPAELARVESVEFVDGSLKINCSAPVTCTTGDWNGKVWVDVKDSVLSTEAKEIYIGSGGVERARLGQYDDTTVRVTLDLAKPHGYCIDSLLPTSQIVLKLSEPVTLQPAVEPQTGASPPSGPSKQSNGKRFTVNAIRVDRLSDDAFQVVVDTTGRASAYIDYGALPPQIVLGLPGGTLAAGCGDVAGSHSLVKAIGCRRSAKGEGFRVEIDLTRVLAYSLDISSSAVTLRARLPDRAGGGLASKMFVIDPGHGGDKPGAHYCGVMEKSVNLQLACELAAALEREGARVCLTRGDDNPSLASRPEMAVYNKADFFISLHCNACKVLNSASGIETFYHESEPGLRQPMAFAVQASICLHTGMKSRYVKGRDLAVLRGLVGTGIPGVLLECGYLNHYSDRARLVTSEYRAKVIAGIIGGLKAYIDGTPIVL